MMLTKEQMEFLRGVHYGGCMAEQYLKANEGESIERFFELRTQPYQGEFHKHFRAGAWRGLLHILNVVGYFRKHNLKWEELFNKQNPKQEDNPEPWVQDPDYWKQSGGEK